MLRRVKTPFGSVLDQGSLFLRKGTKATVPIPIGEQDLTLVLSVPRDIEIAMGVPQLDATNTERELTLTLAKILPHPGATYWQVTQGLSRELLMTDYDQVLGVTVDVWATAIHGGPGTPIVRIDYVLLGADVFEMLRSERE